MQPNHETLDDGKARIERAEPTQRSRGHLAVKLDDLHAERPAELDDGARAREIGDEHRMSRRPKPPNHGRGLLLAEASRLPPRRTSL